MMPTGISERLKLARQEMPTQFWLLMGGSLINSTGGAMIWPFLSSYLKERLGIPLTTVTLLLTLNAVMGILFSFLAGVLADRFGRKGVMVVSLFAGVLYYLLMGQGGSLFYYAVLLAFWGALNPLYPIGANAMIADMVPPARRIEAYSMIRIVHNAGVAIGPVIGGLLANTSINAAFYGAAGAFLVFGLFILFLIHETLKAPAAPQGVTARRDGGYTHLFKDRLFIGFIISFIGSAMASAMLFILLPVYTKEQFAMPESQYSYIVSINAMMVLFVQYFVTRLIRDHPAMPVLAVGALFYALGVGGIALGTGFWGFALAMIIMTIGELVMTPTAVSLVASVAPTDMRGRYMSVYGLTWPVAAGIGPILGGLLYDHISPVSMWYGGFLFGLASAAGFLILWRKPPTQQDQTASTTA
ncbi:MAG: MFS transporter [Anaerolineaceae bacterium]|nr:MFS transporter [Anaerolineaceae bacterium]